jgi:hypothetical protein
MQPNEQMWGMFLQFAQMAQLFAQSQPPLAAASQPPLLNNNVLSQPSVPLTAAAAPPKKRTRTEDAVRLEEAFSPGVGGTSPSFADDDEPVVDDRSAGDESDIDSDEDKKVDEGTDEVTPKTNSSQFRTPKRTQDEVNELKSDSLFGVSPHKVAEPRRSQVLSYFRVDIDHATIRTMYATPQYLQKWKLTTLRAYNVCRICEQMLLQLNEKADEQQRVAFMDAHASQFKASFGIHYKQHRSRDDLIVVEERRKNENAVPYSKMARHLERKHAKVFDLIDAADAQRNPHRHKKAHKGGAAGQGPAPPGCVNVTINVDQFWAMISRFTTMPRELGADPTVVAVLGTSANTFHQKLITRAEALTHNSLRMAKGTSISVACDGGRSGGVRLTPGRKTFGVAARHNNSAFRGLSFPVAVLNADSKAGDSVQMLLRTVFTTYNMAGPAKWNSDGDQTLVRDLTCDGEPAMRNGCRQFALQHGMLFSTCGTHFLDRLNKTILCLSYPNAMQLIKTLHNLTYMASRSEASAVESLLKYLTKDKLFRKMFAAATAIDEEAPDITEHARMIRYYTQLSSVQQIRRDIETRWNNNYRASQTISERWNDYQAACGAPHSLKAEFANFAAKMHEWKQLVVGIEAAHKNIFDYCGALCKALPIVDKIDRRKTIKMCGQSCCWSVVVVALALCSLNLRWRELPTWYLVLVREAGRDLGISDGAWTNWFSGACVVHHSLTFQDADTHEVYRNGWKLLDHAAPRGTDSAGSFAAHCPELARFIQNALVHKACSSVIAESVYQGAKTVHDETNSTSGTNLVSAKVKSYKNATATHHGVVDPPSFGCPGLTHKDVRTTLQLIFFGRRLKHIKKAKPGCEIVIYYDEEEDSRRLTIGWPVRIQAKAEALEWTRSPDESDDEGANEEEDPEIELMPDEPSEADDDPEAVEAERRRDAESNWGSAFTVEARGRDQTRERVDWSECRFFPACDMWLWPEENDKGEKAAVEKRFHPPNVF